MRPSDRRLKYSLNTSQIGPTFKALCVRQKKYRNDTFATNPAQHFVAEVEEVEDAEHAHFNGDLLRVTKPKSCSAPPQVAASFSALLLPLSPSLCCLCCFAFASTATATATSANIAATAAAAATSTATAAVTAADKGADGVAAASPPLPLPHLLSHVLLLLLLSLLLPLFVTIAAALALNDTG